VPAVIADELDIGHVVAKSAAVNFEVRDRVVMLGMLVGRRLVGGGH
jgi:hypothetical protein